MGCCGFPGEEPEIPRIRNEPNTKEEHGMKMKGLLILGAIAALATGCAGTSSFHSASDDVHLVPASGMIEFAVDKDGDVTEVEYHVSKDAIPEKVLQSAEEMFPGALLADAEKEWVGSTLYYEVTKKKGGEAYEVMMTPKGKPYRMEMTVKPSDVPAGVLGAADEAIPGGRRSSVEKILDGDKNLLEYHIKKEVKGIKYKILVGPDGEVLCVYREVPAEIEVPVKW
jgi:hypothetical protein